MSPYEATSRIRAARRGLAYRRRLRAAVRANVSIGDDFHIGNDSVLWAPRGLTIGNGCFVGSNCRIEVDGTVGDHMLMANSVAIIGRRDHAIDTIGVPITQTAWVGDVPEDLSDPVDIGCDVWIGFGAIVLSGVRIGSSSIIGAGSLVTRDVPSNTIVAGHPARVLGTKFPELDTLSEHWEKLAASGATVPELKDSEPPASR